VSNFRQWFEDDARDDILAQIENRVTEEWEREVLRPLRDLCGDATIASGT
jgi:hypothetical protein